MLTPLVTLLNSKHKSVNALILIILALTLQACGLPDGSREGIGAGVNSVDNTDENAPKESITIEIEKINGEIANGVVSIVVLDHNFNENDVNNDLPIPPPKAEKIPEVTGRYRFQFDSVYQEQVNIVVKVVLDNKQVLYSPLYSLQNDDQTIKVNIISHYVLKKLFDTIDSADELSKFSKCSNNDGCANQSVTKANLLEQITIAAQAYEIEFSPIYSVIGAVDALDTALVLNKDQESITHLEFRNHIETAVSEITRITSPIAKGTSTNFDLLAGLQSGNPTTAEKYNSVLFGLSLTSSTPNAEEQVLIGAYTSHKLDTKIGIDNTEVTRYPNLFHTYFLLDRRRDSTISEIPFLRTALTISDDSEYNLTRGRDSAEFKDKTFSFNLTDTFLSTDGFLLTPRIIEQFTNKDPANDNVAASQGWQFDPMFSKLYRANEYEAPAPEALTEPLEGETGDNSDDETDTEETSEVIDYGSAPTWLLSANYSKGAKYPLTKSSDDDKPVRGPQEEASQIFSWEIHGLETNPDFSLSEISGKEYGVINYSIKFNMQDTVMTSDVIDPDPDTDSDPGKTYTVLKTYAEMLEWDVISSSNIKVTQPADHETNTLARLANNDFIGVTTETGTDNEGTFSEDHGVFFLKDGENNDIKTGQVILDGGSTPPEGHVSQNGNYMAFAFDTIDSLTDLNREEGIRDSDRGAGIIIATKKFNLEANSFGPEDTIYQLQGNSLGIDAKSNTLMNFNGSSLTINWASATSCSASLELNRSYLQHQSIPPINRLLEPISAPPAVADSQSCTITGNMIQMTFANIIEKTLTLKGFISEDDVTSTPGNLISLLWIQDDNLGLVFAMKEQGLCHSFEETDCNESD